MLYVTATTAARAHTPCAQNATVSRSIGTPVEEYCVLCTIVLADDWRESEAREEASSPAARSGDSRCALREKAVLGESVIFYNSVSVS
jgi:hypothetical protein